MAFKPNYRQERNSRAQAKEQKKQAKLAKREAAAQERKTDPALPEEGVDDEHAKDEAAGTED